jgi:hypothetical protein
MPVAAMAGPLALAQFCVKPPFLLYAPGTLPLIAALSHA